MLDLRDYITEALDDFYEFEEFTGKKASFVYH